MEVIYVHDNRPNISIMAHHKLTDEEKIHVRTIEDMAKWKRVFAILDDIEGRLIILETKTK